MGGKQKQLISINDNLKHPIQERGEIRSYECSLVYESKVERKTESKLTGHSMKLLKINRLEEINTRYNSNRLEKTSFFQTMKKVERTSGFHEEKFSGSDPGTEDAKVIKEKSHSSETGTNSTEEEEPPDSAEGSIQNIQSCCHEEEVDELNKENAEMESPVLLQMDSPEFHSEGTEEKEEIAFESCYRRSSVQESFTVESQQEDDVTDDACERITGQEIERESPADEETEEHQVSGDEEEEERMNEGEGVASKNEKEDEEPSAPPQNEDEAGQSHEQEPPEGILSGINQFKLSGTYKNRVKSQSSPIALKV